MNREVLMKAIVDAKSAISLIRFRETQFILPLADAKLIRISNYLEGQLADLEKQAWEEAGMEAA